MKTFFTLFIYSLITISALAQPGTLDRSFGDTGVVITQFSSSLLSAVAIQHDNKIIVAGQGAANNINGFLLSRYLTNGSLDTLFGTAGISLINNIAAIHSIIILDDNSIIAAGSGYGPDQHIQLAKYTANGSLDSSFGENGQINQSFRGVDALSVRAAKLQQDGKLVVAGAAYFLDEEYAYEPKIMTARFNADGSVDKSFGGKGYVLMDGQIANALVIQPDGKIVIGGDTGLDDMFITARYLPNGSLDSSFADNGVVTTTPKNHRSYINALALQPDGKIIAAGAEYNYLYMLAVRYLPDGSLDESFGDGGFAKVNFENGSDVKDIALQTDGKIVLAGSNGNFYNTSFLALSRLHANGVIDSSFGTNGLTETNIDGLDFGTACALQQDGKIILGGQDKSINLILARYNNDVQNKTPLARIKKWIEHHILHWQNMQPSNTSYYTIEHSNNATSGFTQIAKIKSEIGNPRLNESVGQAKSEIYNYALPARAIINSSGVNYYRINAVSSSGNITASAIISDEETEDAKISVYPNPVQDVLHINGLNQNAKYEIRITNEKGNVFAKASANKVNSYNLNIQNLHNGIYYAAIISSSNKPVLLKFIKE